MATRQKPWDGHDLPPIEIESGDLSNLGEVMAVMENAFPKTYGEGWNYHQCRSMLAMPSARLLLARRNTAACGFVISRRAADEEELLMIAVAPEYRCQGVGYLLLEQMLQTARINNVVAVFLEMRADNPAAKLYAKFGFQEIGLRKAYYTGSNSEKFDAITYKTIISD